ncbi:MAG: WG repeat-containing protein, partial [Bacteroidota bacterium]
YGAYDLFGQKLLDCTYSSINPENDSLVFVSIKKGEKYSSGVYLKSKGIFIPTKYETITNVNGNRFIVSMDKQYFIIDASDKIISQKYQSLYQTEHGCFIFNSRGKFGALTSSLSLLIPAVNASLSGAKSGFIMATDAFKYGFIDLNGNTLIKASYNSINQVSDDLIAVGVTEDYPVRFRLFSLSAKGFVNNDTYENFGESSHGLIAVASGDKMGFVNEKGELVIGMNYESTFYMEEDYGAYGEEGDYYEMEQYCYNSTQRSIGAMNEYPSYSEYPIYSDGARFSEGKTVLSYESGTGYLDSAGAVVIPFSFSSGMPFMNGVATVSRIRNSISEPLIIDASGKTVLQGYSIQEFSTDGSRIVAHSSDNQYIVYDLSNKNTILKVDYSKIDKEHLTEMRFNRIGYYLTYKDEKIYVSPSGKWMMDPGRKFVEFENKSKISVAYQSYNSGEYDEAIDVLNEVLRSKGEDCEALAVLGKCYLQKNDIETAMNYIDRYMALNKGNTDLLYEIFYKQKEEQDWYGVISTLSRIISIQKSVNADLYSNRAFAYNETGQYDEAIEDYTVVLSKSKDLYAFNNRGYAYKQKGLYMKALADFSVGIQNITSSSTDEIKQLLYGGRGDALYQLNRKSEACEAWKKGAQLGSDGCLRAYNYNCR